ncbi:hypothetical protein GCM10023311_26240 [Flaviramulus aquimarinus]|uniref:SnoaL-like domain-containing protein n=1 Tax=Flaviramulus aquimarinus TaxID=1170456 RepID=A0ABP9FMI8_9FLAO
MKKLFLLGLAIILFVACQNQPQRYFEASPEIETLKAGIEAYEAQNWDAWKANFADSAKIFHNTNKGSSPDQLMAGMKQMLSNFSAYKFSDEGEVYEMIIDKNKETWVNYWGTWMGETNKTEKGISVPVHLTVQFVDGKITQEYAYYDTSSINQALTEIAAAAEEEEETEDAE